MQVYYVESNKQFPDWRLPCPACKKEKCISTRKDGTAAWCKQCGTNWKLKTFTSQPTNQPSGQQEQPMSINQDFIDLLTTVVQQNNKILEILQREMPEEV